MPFNDLANCGLCPRRCGVDRKTGQVGRCRAGNVVEIYRYGRHNGEEPPISGSKGSGTIFFTRCTMECIYCQNYRWSQLGDGEKYSQEGLASILVELAKEGCHNWNLVSPTPWMPWIEEVLIGLGGSGLKLPVVYNTSGYERVETLERYSDSVDIYLTDLRYSCEETAFEGSKVRGYVAQARAALEKMWELAGPLEIDQEGIARKGVICRVLILPGRADEAIENLRWITDRFDGRMHVSLMAQYLPSFTAISTEGWNRRITRQEYELVTGWMEKFGFEKGWIQDFEGETPENLIGFQMKKNKLQKGVCDL